MATSTQALATWMCPEPPPHQQLLLQRTENATLKSSNLGAVRLLFPSETTSEWLRKQAPRSQTMVEGKNSSLFSAAPKTARSVSPGASVSGSAEPSPSCRTAAPPPPPPPPSNEDVHS
ncbi:hypothetical protein Q8A73_014469 [Channa argus]|nr:hypothetical protein Q8A73_014469 [Channa argus]